MFLEWVLSAGNMSEYDAATWYKRWMSRHCILSEGSRELRARQVASWKKWTQGFQTSDSLRKGGFIFWCKNYLFTNHNSLKKIKQCVWHKQKKKKKGSDYKHWLCGQSAWVWILALRLLGLLNLYVLEFPYLYSWNSNSPCLIRLWGGLVYVKHSVQILVYNKPHLPH